MKQLGISLFALCALTACTPTQVQEEGEYHHILTASAVHASLLMELGAADRLVGICDGDYVVDSTLRAAHLEDFGPFTSPDGERILAAGTDAIMLSKVEGMSYGTFATLGLPLIECTDHLAATPLERAASMKEYGKLVGKAERADSIYASVTQRYNAIKMEIHSSKTTTALTDLPQSAGWYVPGGQSYLATLFHDAGYVLPCSDGNDATGSVCLAVEQVMAWGSDAEVWFIKYAAPEDLTYEALLRQYPFAAHIKAFRQEAVYGCNTLHIPYYEHTPFHPDRLLRDLVEHTGVYFSPLRHE